MNFKDVVPFAGANASLRPISSWVVVISDGEQGRDVRRDVQTLLQPETHDGALYLQIPVELVSGAAQVLITAVVVNDMASDAEESQDATQAQEVQGYIADNDVEISDTHVDTYNDSLDAVEESAQVFAAFTAVQNDSELMTEMQTTVDNAGPNSHLGQTSSQGIFFLHKFEPSYSQLEVLRVQRYSG